TVSDGGCLGEKGRYGSHGVRGSAVFQGSCLACRGEGTGSAPEDPAEGEEEEEPLVPGRPALELVVCGQHRLEGAADGDGAEPLEGNLILLEEERGYANVAGELARRDRLGLTRCQLAELLEVPRQHRDQHQ